MEICLLWKYALIQNFHFKMKIQARIIILLKRYLRKISIIHNMYSINRGKVTIIILLLIAITQNSLTRVTCLSNVLYNTTSVIWTLSICPATKSYT